MQERLQKILARVGVGSRRTSENLIEEGRVTVNGVPAKLGDKADPEKDTIKVDGKSLKPHEPLQYIALNKPRGVVSSVNSQDTRPNVRALVSLPGRLYPVGRLDVDSEGLILLTNDGELADHLTHPRYGHEKEYRVLIATEPDVRQLAAWRHGVVLEDGNKTLPADVRIESHTNKGTWLRVIMKEGRKRQIREVGSRIGLPVLRIIRTRIDSLYLGNLKPGKWRKLTSSEIQTLKKGKKRSSI
jgi:23S rRNA pseudouridine2605 synthase